MQLIDERGRLFGVVNVVDALVVLLVLAVVVAGAALVLGGDESAEPAEPTEPPGQARTLTVSTGAIPPSVASLVSTGDALGLGSDATITDVYLTPAGGNNVQATLRIRATDDRPGGVFTVDGTAIRAGQSLTLASDAYQLQGRVDDTNATGSFPVENRSAVVETRLPATAAASLEAGERVRVAGQRVATVESVASYPTNDPSVRHVELGVRLRALALGEDARFAGRPLTVGTTLPLRTDTYDLSGRVTALGTTSPPGDPKTVTARVVWEPVDPTVADGVQVGATEESHGTTYARVTGKTTRPATAIVTSDGGHIYARDHPRAQNVTLTVELRGRQTGSGLTFHGRPLEHGTTVICDLGNTTVKGTVIALD